MYPFVRHQPEDVHVKAETCRMHIVNWQMFDVRLQPRSRWPLEDGTVRLSRNVCKKFPLFACITTQKSAFLGKMLLIVNCVIFRLNDYQSILHLYCLNLSCVFYYIPSLMVPLSALTTKSAICSDSSVHFHHTSRRHVPEGSSLIYRPAFHFLHLPLKFLLLIFLLKSSLTLFFSEKTVCPFNGQNLPTELPIALAPVRTLYMCAFVSCVLTF